MADRNARHDARAGDGDPPGLPIGMALTAGIVLLVAAAIALSLSAGYEIARRNTSELTHDKAGLIVRTVMNHTRDYLSPIRAQLDYLAAAVEQDRIDLADPKSLGPLLTASLAAAPQVSVVAYVTPDLRVLRAFRNRAGRPVTFSDWRSDPGYTEALALLKRTGAPYWGEFYVAEPVGRTFINFFMPLRQGGRFAGALVAGVSIVELSRFLYGLGQNYGVNTFILYGRDRVLAHPSLATRFPVVTDAQPLPALSEVDDPVLRRIWAATRDPSLDPEYDHYFKMRMADIDGTRYVFLYRQLAGYGDRLWTVGGYAPLVDVAPQFGRLGYLGWIGLAVLGLAIIVAMLLGRGLARPVRRLAAAASHIRTLDLGGAPVLRRGPFRELNEAADAFNAMVHGLRAFAAYVPRHLVMRLIDRHPGGPARSHEREITVMFTDIVGFTSLAEDMPAAAVATLLNEHFGLVDRCIDAEGGVVDKYIGDSVMAFWGAPEDQPDHAARACRAALAIGRAMEADNTGRRQAGQPPLRLRIGIHTGRALVGNIGGSSRLNYTIIGDTVNIAQRLETLARRLAPAEAENFTVVSSETAGRLDAAFATRGLGRHVLRGRHERTEVFGLDPA